MDRMRDRGCPNPNFMVCDANTFAKQFWAALGYRRENTVEYAKEL